MVSSRLAVASIILTFAIVSSSCSSYSTSPSPVQSPASDGSSPSVTIPMGAEFLGNRAYAPDNLNVGVGTTVTWVNADSIAHTSKSDATGWDSGIVASGGRFSTAFPTAGAFSYHCAIHPGMVGTVIVR